MKSTVETLSPTRVKLAIEVPFDELKPSLQKAYREIGAQVQVPGFRRGKVPSAVVDQRVGRGGGTVHRAYLIAWMRSQSALL